MENNTITDKKAAKTAAKTLTFTPGPCRVGSGGGTGATRCCNLRRSRRSEGLEAVGRPAVVAPAGWHPLAVCSDDGKRRVAVVSGSTLAAVDPASGAAVEEIGTVRSAATCATPDASGCGFTVMTAEGPLRAVKGSTGDWSLEDGGVNPGAVGLRAMPSGEISVQQGGCSLSRDYASTTDLEPSDRRRIVDTLGDAYARLDSAAREAGVMLQPALARYRLLDSAGRVLFTGPTVLLCAASGRQCADTMVLSSTDRSRIPPFSLTAFTWRLGVSIGEVPAATASQVSALQITMTPQLHPVRLSGAADVCLMHRTVGQQFISAKLPGVPSAREAVDEVMAVAARIDRVERVVATIHRPFAEGARTLAVDVAATGDFADSRARLDAALAQSVSTTPAVDAYLSAPHAFTASAVAESAGLTLWGGLAVIPFEGYRPESFFHDTDSRRWRAYVAVDFADGRRVVQSAEGSTGAPVSFGPMLSYPAPDACSMTVAVSAEGWATRKATFPLRPDASGRMAVYVDPAMCPLTLPDVADTYVVPRASAGAIEMRGRVAAARSDRPLHIVAHAAMGACTVREILPAAISHNSWDFGRTRFYALTDAGIFAVTAARDNSMAVNRVDTGSVARRDAACCAGGKVYVLTDSRRLLRLGASKVDVLDSAVDAVALAASASRDELWAVHPDGTATVYDLADNAATCYSRPDERIASTFCRGGVSLVDDEAGLCDVDRELPPSGGVHVEWSGRIEFPKPRRSRHERLWLDVGALDFSGSVSLSHATATLTAPDAAAEWRIRGSLLSALSLRVPVVYASHALCLKLDGRVSPDFLFATVSLQPR